MGIAVIFPGQGTQTTGMGAPWRDHPAWSVVDRAEAALGEPLSSLVLDAPAEQLARTRDAQLAVLLTSLVAWEAVRERIEAPLAFAGHSLGQVTALIASGALPLEEGVQFAARRAELTQSLARVKTSFAGFDRETCEQLVYRGWWLTGATLATYHREALPAALPSWRHGSLVSAADGAP